MDVKDNGHLQHLHVPSRTELHELERRQCAHVERAEEFTFDVTWTHQQVDDYLCCIVFPILFKYLERTEKGKHKDGSPRRQWVLINKEKQRYEIVAITEPTGADLA